MTNLTLAVDEETLRKARIRAIQRGTSVNSLIRNYLERLAGESQASAGIADFLDAVSGAGASSGTEGRAWTRDELYEQ